MCLSLGLKIDFLFKILVRHNKPNSKYISETVVFKYSQLVNILFSEGPYRTGLGSNQENYSACKRVV